MEFVAGSVTSKAKDRLRRASPKQAVYELIDGGFYGDGTWYDVALDTG